MDSLTKGCWCIKNAFDLDIAVIDEKLNIQTQISSFNYPAIIEDEKKSMYPYLLNECLSMDQDTFSIYTDKFKLSYLVTTLHKNDEFKGIVVVGPYLSEDFSGGFLSQVIRENNLPLPTYRYLENFYKNLSKLKIEYLSVGNIVVNLCRYDTISSSFVALDLPMKNEVSRHSRSNTKMYDANILIRYELEKKIMSAVTIGDTQEVKRLYSEFFADFSYRTPNDHLRSSKNVAYVFGTMLRLAAEKGGVNPIYLHQISENLAYKVEECKDQASIATVEYSMIAIYCDAVKELSTKEFSNIVKQAVTYIKFNYDEPLNLQIVADSIRFDRTYLAKSFRRETNMSVVEYINKVRIDKAVFLIEQNQLSFIDISVLVGYNNYSYFCKVFKDTLGLSPREYRNTNL